MSSQSAAAASKKDRLGLNSNETASRPVPSLKNGFKINWLSTSIILVPPMIIAAAILAGYPLQTNTLIVGLIFYALNGFGITLGYHRLFSHRAFTAHWLLEWGMAFWGAGAFQGSIKWWGRNHRIHHRYVDTDKDPYNAKRGFFYTHVGWMLMQQDYGILGRVDVQDFAASKMINFQHVYYLPIALLGGIILPTVICGLGWGDWVGGYCYAALFKMVIVHHTTFFINSLAHSPLFGATQNFSDNHTSHDSMFCALLTLGEGYHNYHHEFAQDYRNGIKWYHYDPTKWLIRLCESVGLAKNLVRVPNEVIQRNMYGLRFRKHQQEAEACRKKIDQIERKFAAPVEWTWAEFEDKCRSGAKLIVVGDYILDMEKIVPTGPGYTHKSKDIVWYNAHPGGKKMLDMFVGKDATDAMCGGVYKHSEGALNLVVHLRVASLKRPASPLR